MNTEALDRTEAPGDGPGTRSPASAIEEPGRPDRAVHGLFSNPRVLLKALVALGIVTLGSLAMALVGVLTLFRTRRFQGDVLARWIGRACLRVWGVRLSEHGRGSLPSGQVVFVSNHTSSVDMFVLIALGLPNARFFLSGFLRKILPLWLLGELIGIFWTVPQDRPEDRRAIFQRATETLRRTGESVYLSPEGMRVTTGRIGAFNKGAFHLATELGAPIVPFYIRVPREVDPGLGIGIRPGTVEVHYGAPIETVVWELEDLIENKERVRGQMCAMHRELRVGTLAETK